MKTKLLIVEFVTGGGFANSPLPKDLMREGALMVKSMLLDLAELPDVHVSILRDARLPPVREGVEILWVTQSMDEVLQKALKTQDVVWLVAPETGNVLQNLTHKIKDTPHLGCTAEAVYITSSKWRTSQQLSKAHVPVVKTYQSTNFSPDESISSWVIKPDDGAGCTNTRKLTHLPKHVASHEVVQPWLVGESMSLSLLCRHDRVQVLSVNRQILKQDDEGLLKLAALEVNVHAASEYQDLAQRVYAAVSGLRGTVGIDFVETKNGPVVLEINPRMTTSFCALQEAVGINLAGELLAEAGFLASRPLHQMGRSMVRIELI